MKGNISLVGPLDLHFFRFLHSSGTRAIIFKMRVLRKLIATTVMLVMGLSSMSVAMVAQRRMPQASKPMAPMCPKHATYCCCPELCNPPKVSKVAPGCHHSDKKPNNPGLTPASQTFSCFLKAGCGKNNDTSSTMPFLKDFVPEPLEEFGARLTIASFVSALESTQPLEFPSALFSPSQSLLIDDFLLKTLNQRFLTRYCLADRSR